MPFFRREPSGDKQQKDSDRTALEIEAQLQERSKEALLAGELPIRAQERVAQIHDALTGGASAPVFSSDLSVNEFLMARQLGYEPVGLVSGSCVFHIGWNRWTVTGELDAQTNAMASAGNTAVERLRQEAHGMGALGVVGVRLEIRRPAWGEHLIEVVAIGTAIRARGSAAHTEAFVCGLSTQEYCALLRSGSRPAGLAFGNSTYYIYTNWTDARKNLSWYNQEVPKYTQSVYEAQRYAFGRMEAKARALKAHGIVGVHLSHTLRQVPRGSSDSEADDDYVIEYIAWGTAIIEAPAGATVARPSMVLDLEDLARVTRVTAATQRKE